MTSCGFEKDLSLALHDGRWPDGCDPALRRHVAACASCSDLVLVTSSLQSARAATLPAPLLPPPGVLWWRAQIRRRQGAAERMSRPIVLAEALTLAATLFALVLAARRWFDFVDWTSLRDRLPFADPQLRLADLLAALPPGRRRC